MKKVENYRQNLFEICSNLLEKAYQKEGHSTWKYAFIKKCDEVYNEKIYFTSLKQMETGEKNITSKIYVLLLLEIERNYNISLLDNLEKILKNEKNGFK